MRKFMRAGLWAFGALMVTLATAAVATNYSLWIIGRTGGLGAARVAIQDLQANQSTDLFSGGSNAVYVPTGQPGVRCRRRPVGHSLRPAPASHVRYRGADP